MEPKLLSAPIMEQSEAYFAAFEHLNECLFEGKLRAPMLVFTRNPAVVKGHFAPNQWVNEDDEIIHEIAINANWMLNQDIVDLMHILGHEMCHLWQEDFGTPSRPGYHNAKWALLAERIGLEPQPGSKLHG